MATGDGIIPMHDGRYYSPLVPGTSGYVLTSNGPGAFPTYEPPTGSIGPAGPPGLSGFAFHGDDGEDGLMIPGAVGPSGAAGPAGPSGDTIPLQGMDGIDGEEGQAILVSNILAKARVYLNTATNTTSGAWTKVPLDTVSYDTDGIWDSTNKRLIPCKAGYYYFSGRARTNTNGSLAVAIGKNGAQSVGIGSDIPTSTAVGGGGIIFCNGSTDYLELWIFAGTVRALTTGSFDTYMDLHGPL